MCIEQGQVVECIMKSSLEPGLHKRSLQHQSRERRYHLYLPTTGQPPYPLVFAFHGAGATGKIMLLHSRWLYQAEQSGFVVVAPEGTAPNRNDKPSFRLNPQLWNLDTTFTAAPTGYADDVGFVKAILQELPSLVDIAVNQVYATGFSNGAGLTFRLAAEAGHHFAAISPVAALPYLKSGPPPRAIPAYYLIGSEDPLIPWEGGNVVSPWTGDASIRPPVLPLLQQWAELSRFKPVKDVLHHDTAYEEIKLGVAEDSQFIYSRLFGLGHHWPGGRDVGVPEEVLGKRIKTFDATERIWKFFQQYRLPGKSAP